MTEENQQIVLASEAPQSGALVSAGFSSAQGFELMLRVSKMFAASQLVPTIFQNQPANCAIAIEMAGRIGASPMMVMQNLNIIHNKPSWSSKFLIATVNACGLFSKLKFEFYGTPGTDGYGCRASAREKATGDLLEGPRVDIKMAKAEGWYQKNGSKWPSMTDLMLTYRSASMWANVNAPELTMGIKTREEIEDIEEPVTVIRDQPQGTTATLRAALGVSTPPPPEPVQAPPADVGVHQPDHPAREREAPPAAEKPKRGRSPAPAGQRPADAPPPIEPGPQQRPEPPPPDDDMPPAGPIEMD